MSKLKTLGDFQQIVAKKYGLGYHLVTGHQAKYFNEATMMYVDYLLEQDIPTVKKQFELELILPSKEGGNNE